MNQSVCHYVPLYLLFFFLFPEHGSALPLEIHFGTKKCFSHRLKLRQFVSNCVPHPIAIAFDFWHRSSHVARRHPVSLVLVMRLQSNNILCSNIWLNYTNLCLSNRTSFVYSKVKHKLDEEQRKHYKSPSTRCTTLNHSIFVYRITHPTYNFRLSLMAYALRAFGSELRWRTEPNYANNLFFSSSVIWILRLWFVQSQFARHWISIGISIALQEFNK